MNVNRTEVSLAASDWMREETRFLCGFMAPAMFVQAAFISLHIGGPVTAFSALVNLTPAAVLMVYLGRVLYRARKEGQFFPWGAP